MILMPNSSDQPACEYCAESDHVSIATVEVDGTHLCDEHAKGAMTHPADAPAAMKAIRGPFTLTITIEQIPMLNDCLMDGLDHAYVGDRPAIAALIADIRQQIQNQPPAADVLLPADKESVRLLLESERLRRLVIKATHDHKNASTFVSDRDGVHRLLDGVDLSALIARIAADGDGGGE